MPKRLNVSLQQTMYGANVATPKLREPLDALAAVFLRTRLNLNVTSKVTVARPAMQVRGSEPNSGKV